MSIRFGVRRMGGCAAAVALALFGTPALAQAQDSGRAFSSTSPNLFGNWGGERDKLAQDGAFFYFDYDGQAPYNITGGSKSRVRLANQWVFGGSFDFDKLFHWKGGSFDIMITNRSGRDLGADAQLPADLDVVNNYGIAETWWLTEFAFSQKFLDGKIDWRIGRTPAGTDFNRTDLCDFMNLIFCGTPFTDVTSYSTFFNMGRWGTRLKIAAGKHGFFSIGMYQVNPKYYDPGWAVRHGLSLDIPSGTQGWMFPIQYEWDTTIGGMKGSYQVGVWYSTAPTSDLFYDVNHDPIGLTGLPAMQHGSGYGAYLDVDQRLTDNGNGRGYSMFLNIVQSNPQTESIDQEINLGIKYHQPFNRPDDYIGAGIAEYRNNSRFYRTYVLQNGTAFDPATNSYIGSGNQWNLEAFYKWYVIKSISLSPNIQYIFHPAASSRNDNIFLIGLTTQISF